MVELQQYKAFATEIHALFTASQPKVATVSDLSLSVPVAAPGANLIPRYSFMVTFSNEVVRGGGMRVCRIVVFPEHFVSYCACSSPECEQVHSLT